MRPSAIGTIFQLVAGFTFAKDLGAFAGMGAALGPWATGWLFDLRGNYDLAFNVAVGMCLVSIAAMWLASPRKVRCKISPPAREKCAAKPSR